MSSGEPADARGRLAVVGEIAAEIAHELRNVLQIISASAYVARIELKKDDAQAAQPHVAKIERSARVAHGIVDDLMALARGGEAIDTEEVLLTDVVNAARVDLAAGTARWEDAVEPAALCVRAHGPLLARMLRVLYENAIEASAPREPTVSTRARRRGSHIVVEVADDGPGVPESIADRVFDPLVTGRRGGTGLGLALAIRIAAAHGGSITLVTSESGGAMFRIELPSDAG